MANGNSPEEVIAAADKAGKPRSYEGNGPASARNKSGDTGKLGKRPNPSAAAGDPTPEAKPSRGHIPAARLGARYAIRVNTQPPVDPTAAPTLANARIIPSAINRSRPNFDSGAVGGDET